MDFIVDNNQRKAVWKKIKKNSRKALLISRLAAIFNIAAGIFLVVWGSFPNSIFTYQESWEGNIGDTDYTTLAIALVMSQFVLWFFYWALQIIFDKFFYPEIGERVDESLTVQGRDLIYGYQNRWGNPPSSRVIVTIPLDNVTISINEQKSEVIFKGGIHSKYYENYSHARKTSSKTPNIKEFVIVDFFEPSLIKWLAGGGKSNNDNRPSQPMDIPKQEDSHTVSLDVKMKTKSPANHRTFRTIQYSAMAVCFIIFIGDLIINGRVDWYFLALAFIIFAQTRTQKPSAVKDVTGRMSDEGAYIRLYLEHCEYKAKELVNSEIRIDKGRECSVSTGDDDLVRINYSGEKTLLDDEGKVLDSKKIEEGHVDLYIDETEFKKMDDFFQSIQR